MKKGALFGFDARISMLIYATLSLIAGAILYSVIKDSKTTALYTELQEISKANESYLLQHGKILDKQAETDELTQSTRKITDLITEGDTLSGDPYLNYEISGTALKHNKFGDINIYTLSSDSDWSEIDANSYCTELKACNMWVGLKGFDSEPTMRNLDEKFDDGLALSGDIRYDVASLEIYLKSIPVPNAKRDFIESGVWVTGSWGSCSVSCGTGTQTRSVTCSKAFCSSPKPATSQSCNAGSCGGYWYMYKNSGVNNYTFCPSGKRYYYQCVPKCSGSYCDPAKRPSAQTPVYQCDSPPSGSC